ncbi:MAG: ATP-binding protein [Spirulina sp.]
MAIIPPEKRPSRPRKLPLRWVLIIPFLVQIFAAVSLVGWLSFRNGQRAIATLARELQGEIAQRIEDRLHTYTEIPAIVHQINGDLVRSGRLNLEDSPEIDRHFLQQLFWFPDLSYICWANERGELMGVFHPDNEGNIFVDRALDGDYVKFRSDREGKIGAEVLRAPDYDPRTRPWYRTAVEAKRSTWTTPYAWYGDDILSTDLVMPFYGGETGEELEGVFSASFTLDAIGEFLAGLKIGKSGQAFIFERSGIAIATSTGDTLVIRDGDEFQPISALEIPNPIVHQTAEYLRSHFGDLSQIRDTYQSEIAIAGKKHFLQVTSFQDDAGLDWEIVIVIPEADFMEQIDANTHNTMVLCGVALVVAAGLGILTSRWIVRIIFLLSRGTDAIAKGELTYRVQDTPIGELSILARAFNRMADQLKTAFDTLELKVEERTAELAAAKEAADSANRAKSEFLAHMSHELRTPLNAILGFSQIAIRDRQLSPKQRENIGIINRSGDYLLTLINNVLDLSKMEAGKMTLNPRNFDLYLLLHEIEDLLHLQAESKGLQLLFDRDETLPQYIRTDETKLRQVLLNLINNSIKFTAEGGIAVKVICKGKEDAIATLAFEVQDTGVGIAEEELGQLFEVFGQTESGKYSQQGAGLGLPITQKFVRLMGGEIAVSSTVGKGTTFTFAIEAKIARAADVEPKPTSRQVIALKPGQRTYKILIVDDRPHNRLLLVRLLKPLGFAVQEASNGREAIEKWEVWEPHLIFMDMRMPVMNGYEATQQIKGTLKGNATIIIALTASVLEEEKAIVLSAGCDDFLRKPFREATIFAALEKHLGVEYIYAEEEKLKVTQTNPLSLADLEVMPPEWREQLYNASKALDDDAILALIEEIPAERASLADRLTDLVENFQLKQICQLLG